MPTARTLPRGRLHVLMLQWVRFGKLTFLHFGHAHDLAICDRAKQLHRRVQTNLLHPYKLSTLSDNGHRVLCHSMNR